MSRVWDPFLTDLDREVLAVTGYGARAGLGTHPALLVVDVNYNFCGRFPEPLPAAAIHTRNSCGEAAWNAVRQIEALLPVVRASNIPVIYSTNETPRADGFDSGRWASKNRRRLEDAAPQHEGGNDIVAEISPQAKDILIRKTKPSVFYGTPLLSHLIELSVDTLLICGGTTSGCVRQTVVDAFSRNFYCGVVEDGCFDRTQASHAINLFDMDQKYADVMPLSEIVRYVQDLPAMHATVTG